MVYSSLLADVSTLLHTLQVTEMSTCSLSESSEDTQREVAAKVIDAVALLHGITLTETCENDDVIAMPKASLDASLRRPGWGLIFTGLPGGIQLQAPNPRAGRLVLCSSAYWSGGEMDPDGKITKEGDVLSRYSYSIISDE